MNSHFTEPPRRRYMLVQHCPRSGRRYEWTMVPRSGEGSDIDHWQAYMCMVQPSVLVRHNADAVWGACRREDVRDRGQAHHRGRDRFAGRPSARAASSCHLPSRGPS